MPWKEQLKSKRFRGGYRDWQGKKCYVEGTFDTAAEAIREAGAAEKAQRLPGARHPKAGRVKYGEWFATWIDSHGIATSTEREYRSNANLHILPYWEDVDLDQINMTNGKTWVKALQDPESRHNKLWTAKESKRSPWTIRVAVQIFCASLNAATPPHDNKLSVNPVKGLKWPDLPEGLDRFLTPTEVESITHFMDPLAALIVWTAVSSGLRVGELAGLHTSRIDFERNGINVIEQFDQKGLVMKAVPKDKERRYVPLPSDVAGLLRQHVATLPKARTCGVEHTAGRCPGGSLVFRGPRGGVLKSDPFGRGPWRRALADAEIEGRVRLHDLRHTFASWLIQNGVSMAELARAMGHSSWEVSRRYAHLADAGFDTVRDAIALNTTGARGASRGTKSRYTAQHPATSGSTEIAS
ncbi:tyrosine-type recombinase/integrase [Umezawaea tangerina]|uniref:Phage integrase family protein n=1 Tax=Umezawaea tangerina TaxID=84725 RepID=A0A2T0SPD5_9PSEU|nr:site-specific integrase [Umezawaea tangerina]PRY35270.1 phage integrase family protein [Umezawaea tangerina]